MYLFNYIIFSLLLFSPSNASLPVRKANAVYFEEGMETQKNVAKKSNTEKPRIEPQQYSRSKEPSPFQLDEVEKKNPITKSQ